MSLLRQNSLASAHEDTILRGPSKAARKHCCYNADGFTVIFCCFSVLTAAITVALIIQIQLGHPQVTPHGAIASNDKECSIAGITVMKEGGNAVDVTIATLLCMSVVHPHIVGPGGGGVMLIHDHKANKSEVLDFMVAMPSKHSQPGHLDSVGTIDVKSIGIPSFLHGLEHAHKKHGKLPWKDLFKRAIDLARTGFNISRSLAEASATLAHSLYQKEIGQKPTYFEETFFPGGVALKEGALMIRGEYGDFLELASEKGAAVMWPLSFFGEILHTLNSGGSLITQDDLESYQVLSHPCLHTTIMNNTIFTANGPFGGPRLLMGLHLLHYSNMTKDQSIGSLYHRFINADLLSYQKMLELVSTDNITMTNLTDFQIESFINSTTVEQKIVQLDQDLPHFPDQASTEVTVIDTFDQYVSAIAGLGTVFGSRLMTEHGILFNNLVPDNIAHLGEKSDDLISDSTPGDNSTTETTHVKFGSKEDLELRNKRPMNPYTPVIITNSKQVCGRRAVLASGSVSASMQVVAQLVFRGLNLAAAIEEPRITNKPPSPIVYLDDTVSDLKRLHGSARTYLNKNGVQFAHLTPPIPSVNGVSKITDDLVSQSDTRGGGIAARLDTSFSSQDSVQVNPDSGPKKSVFSNIG